MYSKLLETYGVYAKVAGSDYNFRYQTAGNMVIDDSNRLLNEMDLNPMEIYTGQQTHSATIAYADGVNGEPFAFGRTFRETDGLLTDKSDVGLLIKYADCTPIVLFDPVNHVLANIHSGWRGTTKRISANAIERMSADYGSKPENIIAYVGPSIDQQNYEVGPEVYEAFKDFKDRDHFFIQTGEKYKLSMLDANIDSLLKAGILSKHMEIERSSTFTDGRLHSARGEGKDYQLNGLFAMMKS